MAGDEELVAGDAHVGPAVRRCGEEIRAVVGAPPAPGTPMRAGVVPDDDK